MSTESHRLQVQETRQNNLKGISLEIPHQRLIAVTGISGSGKSSLAFEVIANEGKRLYLQSIPAFARQYVGRHSRPEVDGIKGLYPVITLGQRPPSTSSRTTVGTLSEVHDLMRLLFARFGIAPEGVNLTRSLFSFNSALGACPGCNGLGIQERISEDKLVADPSRTLREGALVPTLPNGYIMYSQVTVDVLDTVCREHGFSVDIPWQDLTDTQRDVILNGSERIKVPFGKHSLESRMKWTGMKAKPREEGFYKGMLPIMSDILKRDRNKNILRFVEAVNCPDCQGKRLNHAALSVTWQGYTIDQLLDLRMDELLLAMESADSSGAESELVRLVKRDLSLLCRLGLGHQRLKNPSGQLSSGELQRIRLVNLLATDLSHVLYVFDEPSIGLHPRYKKAMLGILRQLVDKGNTVMVVEHDPDTIRAADWIVDIGPGAGAQGGELLFNGPLEEFLRSGNVPSPTQLALWNGPTPEEHSTPPEGEPVTLRFRDTEIRLVSRNINVITGLPGSGKRQLLEDILPSSVPRTQIVDQRPIGRTPRSNPATYTGMADHIRDLFAKQTLAKEMGFKKGRFSFNNKGGRCEKCEGAGKIQIGMHYMGAIEVTCDHCNGDRFNADTLRVTYKQKNISQVYGMSISEAKEFFEKEKRIFSYLKVLEDLGLGYLQLGQSSTTLSGGEAQRVKLATVLGKERREASDTWFLLNEPTTGLHHQDVGNLITTLRTLCESGHTVVCLEYQDQFIQAADHQVKLTSDENHQETPSESELSSIHPPSAVGERILIQGASTHNLKCVDASIPKGKLSVVTGLSGSGKTSLVLDTLFAEAQSRYTESLSAYARSFIHQANPAKADAFMGLTPTLAISRKNMPVSPRSTVGTLTGIHEKYRYLYSRTAQLQGKKMSASQFSFNQEAGSCPECGGLGSRKEAEPLHMAPDWTRSIREGAFTPNSAMAYYGNPDGQFVAILQAVAESCGFDIDTPLNDYSPTQLKAILRGTGQREWTTTWQFKTKTRTGHKEITDVWPGFCSLVEGEYLMRKDNKNIGNLKALFKDVDCPMCHGSRMSQEALQVKVQELDIAELCAQSIDQTAEWFKSSASNDPDEERVFREIATNVLPTLLRLQQLGLGHLSLDRNSGSLSGGEGQRLRIGSLLSGELIGMTYVLDEPTIGLHADDVGKLIEILHEIRDMGNTVIVVEHDPQLISSADHIIEVGPGAGMEGGRIVKSGKVEDFKADPPTLTSSMLAFSHDHTMAKEKFHMGEAAFGLRGVNLHNLQDLDIDFPKGFIALTGTSGAGKTTLTRDVLVPSLSHGHAVNCQSFYSHVEWSEVMRVDQNALEGSRSSTLASHTGILQQLQTLYASSGQAKQAGLKKSAFSYQHKDGRCEQCKGLGQVKIAMDFLDDTWNPCESCAGSRYRPEVLTPTYLGKNIAEMLSLSVRETQKLFAGDFERKTKELKSTLQQLMDLGLGHLVLGQSTASLSGGEAQRIKLMDTLMENETGPMLIVLDEPTAGLHQRDIDVLLSALSSIVDKGHTVLAVEHNGYFISQVDAVLELHGDRN